MTTYAEKLRHPKWQKKRLKVLEAAGFRCELCDQEDETLNVHHTRYEYGRDPWDYPDDSLLCLCQTCHKAIHTAKHAILAILPSCNREQIEVVLGFARAISGAYEDRFSSFWEAVGFGQGIDINDMEAAERACRRKAKLGEGRSGG